jgi:DNA-binding transcriptional ArsR family regulator
MAYYSHDLAPIFHALGDPTRLAVIEQLGKGPATISALAAPFSMALPSFMKHIAVLEAAGLITTEKAGRQRFVRLNAMHFMAASKWLGDRRTQWRSRFKALENQLNPETAINQAASQTKARPINGDENG